MATLLDEFNAMKIKVAKAMATNDQATLQRKIHVVDHEMERERKRTNPAKSVRVSLNCYSPEIWSEFQMEKDRFVTVAVDPRIAVELMIRALRQADDATLREWVKAGHEEAPGPEKASIPEWLR